MRICLVYDCLYPWTVGGAERWYRNLGERLAVEGHSVTYLTLRQWDSEAPPSVRGVQVVAVGPRMRLYASGRRRIVPPLVFGGGVLLHLGRFGGRYDVVHTASFPYFSLLAAGLLRPIRRFQLVVDWHELWTRDYWREYLGPPAGAIGWAVQRLCIRLPQRAFCFAQVTATRLQEQGLAGDVTVLTGEYAGPTHAASPRAAEPMVVFAGRHIPEKRVPALVHGFARAREKAPELKLRILGDGPDRAKVLAAIEEEELGDSAQAPGFVTPEEVDNTLGRALCMVLPSRREGYGMVVVESAARGIPSIVVLDPDNAAVELVDDGINGVIAGSSRPEDLAAAILRVRAAGPTMRASTAAWFERNADRLSLSGSLDLVAEAYGPNARS